MTRTRRSMIPYGLIAVLAVTASAAVMIMLVDLLVRAIA